MRAVTQTHRVYKHNEEDLWAESSKFQNSKILNDERTVRSTNQQLNAKRTLSLHRVYQTKTTEIKKKIKNKSEKTWNLL